MTDVNCAKQLTVAVSTIIPDMLAGVPAGVYPTRGGKVHVVSFAILNFRWMVWSGVGLDVKMPEYFVRHPQQQTLGDASLNIRNFPAGNSWKKGLIVVLKWSLNRVSEDPAF